MIVTERTHPALYDVFGRVSAGACGKSGDAIAMVRLRKNAGFAAACDFLESLKRPRSDGRTADLFAAGGKRR